MWDVIIERENGTETVRCMDMHDALKLVQESILKGETANMRAVKPAY